LYATMKSLMYSPRKEGSAIFVGLELVACHVARSYNMKTPYGDSEYVHQILVYPSNPDLKKCL